MRFAMMNRGLCFVLLFMISLCNGGDNGLSRTPPMGWNSWNYFGCNVNCTADGNNCITEKLFMEMADAMVSSGMAAVGYEYINLDDCWLAPTRDENGRLQPDPQRFPSGIKALADYVHSKGLKFGIYEDCGDHTCEGYPGSNSSEIVDVATFVQWGVDYVKLDGCGFSEQQLIDQMPEKYTQWSELLLWSGRPMVFSCSWPAYFDFSNLTTPWDYVAEICNLWREWNDIRPNWPAIMDILDYQESEQLAKWAGPGHWNDPDMLEIGNGLTYDEGKSQFSIWAILAAPLIAGNDLRAMSSETVEILTNSEVIAVDQDSMGIQGTRVAKSGLQEVWSRPLSNGDFAVALLNNADTNSTITATWSQVGWALPSAFVRDLWLHQDLGVFKNSFTAYSVAPHGVVMLRISKPI